MATMTIVGDSVANGSRTFEGLNVGTSNPIPDYISRVIPPVTSAAQAYFWSRLWQQGEALADADYRAGQFRVFDNSDEAIRHLLSADDE